MEMGDPNLKNTCPLPEISSYIDGELPPAAEIELEAHIGGCGTCSAELNLQKQFLCALNSSLESEREISLPENFAKVIATNAETRVNGLRRPSERYNAAFVCSGLFLIIILAAGADSGSFTGTFLGVLEKAVAVGTFAAHLAYDITIGAVVVLRSLSSHLIFGSPVSFAAMGFLGLYLFLVSHLAAFFNRG
jgi:anti-sigma factor RsiW